MTPHVLSFCNQSSRRGRLLFAPFAAREEVVDLRKEDLMAPVTRFAGYGRWTVIVKPETRGISSQTGTNARLRHGGRDVPVAPLLRKYKMGIATFK